MTVLRCKTLVSDRHGSPWQRGIIQTRVHRRCAVNNGGHHTGKGSIRVTEAHCGARLSITSCPLLLFSSPMTDGRYDMHLILYFTVVHINSLTGISHYFSRRRHSCYSTPTADKPPRSLASAARGTFLKRKSMMSSQR